MKKEKIILSFVAVFIGLLVAAIAFYFYESANRIADQKQNKVVSKIALSPTPKQTFFLTLDSPKDEEVFTKKIITISGKTTADAIVAIISKDYQDIVTPSQNGDFLTTISILDDQNMIDVIAIAPNGQSERLTRTVTFSTEEF